MERKNLTKLVLGAAVVLFALGVALIGTCGTPVPGLR